MAIVRRKTATPFDWIGQMADHVTPHFQNTSGHDSIAIGAREFMCIGANPPFDHPHVFLDLGDGNEIVCPYCSTLYKFDATLKPTETSPADCLWSPDTATNAA